MRSNTVKVWATVSEGVRKAPRWFAVGALCAATVLGANQILSPAPVKSVVFMLGKLQCDPNEGLKEVRVSLTVKGERRYSFSCNNSALFLNQNIPDELEPTPGLIAQSSVVRPKEVIK